MGRILVMDDEAAIRALIRRGLESMGHEVIEAKDGREGLELYRAQPTDLVITDIVMPRQQGLDCLVALLQIDPNARVFAMSSGSQSVVKRSGTVWRLDVLDAARSLGATRTFWKPIDLRALLAAVEQELEQAA